MMARMILARATRPRLAGTTLRPPPDTIVTDVPFRDTSNPRGFRAAAGFLGNLSALPRRRRPDRTSLQHRDTAYAQERVEEGAVGAGARRQVLPVRNVLSTNTVSVCVRVCVCVCELVLKQIDRIIYTHKHSHTETTDQGWNYACARVCVCVCTRLSMCALSLIR